MKVTVKLNGTNANPYERLGLTRNPFPRIPKAEYAAANDLLARLEAEPIVDVTELRERLAGCSPEFIELCCKSYKPGQMTEFGIEW